MQVLTSDVTKLISGGDAAGSQAAADAAAVAANAITANNTCGQGKVASVSTTGFTCKP
jgi:hypothetical protein